MNSSAFRPLFGLGMILLIIGLPVTFFGYLITFDPPANSTITVNGVTKYPGDPGYKSSAEIILYIGLIIVLVSIILLVFAFIVKIRGSSVDESYNRSPYDNQTFFTSQPSTGFENQPNSPSQPNHFIGFSNQATRTENSNLSCPACGAKITKNETFCSSCGKRL